MHFELIPESQIIKYRKVISPRYGGMHFPDTYFDEKTTTIPDQDMERVATAFERMIRNHTLEDKLSLLPPGAERDAYMRITFCSHNASFYSNVYVEENGIKVIREPVAEEFTQIVNVLKQRCALL